MFVAKSRQKTIFDLDFNLPEKMVDNIKKTWAGIFLRYVLPLLVKAEKDFADLYCPNNGSPNIPVALLLGVLILKEIFDLTDEETLEHLEFNILWQYALEVRFEQAHVCRKTLHNFRTKMLQSLRHRKLFNQLTKAIIEMFALKTGKQRLDSTHVVGNMKIVGRLGLFIQVIEQFLFKLKAMSKKNPEIAEALKNLPEQFHKRYLEREGYFGDVRSSQAKRRLQDCAEDLWYLVELFKNDSKVCNLKQFKNLKRLFKEQCEVVNNEEKVEIQPKDTSEEENEPASGELQEGENGDKIETKTEEVCEEANSQREPNQSEEGKAVRVEEKEKSRSNSAQSSGVSDATRKAEELKNGCEEANNQEKLDKANQNATEQAGEVVRVKEKEDIGSDSLQSPSDPDATYGHKGKGYEFQVSETCDKENPFEVITETQLNGANESDQTQTIPMIEKLDKAELHPDELTVDAGYVSGENIVEAEEKGTQLIGPLPGKAPNPENLSLTDFEFNEDGTRVEHCPNGKCPIDQGVSKTGDSCYARFSTDDCAHCPLRDRCPVKGESQTRMDWDKSKRAIDKRQREVHTKEFKEKYKIRSGIEATNSELKNKHGAGHLRVRGYARIDFAMVMKSLALNIKRMMQYALTTARKYAKDPSASSNSYVFIWISLFLAFINVLSTTMGQFLRKLVRKTKICCSI